MRKTSEMTLEEIKELNNAILTIEEVEELEYNEHIVCIESLGYGMNNRYWIFDVRLEDGENIDVYI